MKPDLARGAHRRFVTRVILVVGFAAAIAAYFRATARPENPLGYDPLENKQYIHDLQVYGGTANVLASEFREWVAGLWYGKNLAYTLAVLTLITVALYRFFSFPLPEEPDDEGPPPPGKFPRPAA
jgi:hypothetical protein